MEAPLYSHRASQTSSLNLRAPRLKAKQVPLANRRIAEAYSVVPLARRHRAGAYLVPRSIAAANQFTRQPYSQIQLLKSSGPWQHPLMDSAPVRRARLVLEVYSAHNPRTPTRWTTTTLNRQNLEGRLAVHRSSNFRTLALVVS